jgi:phage-related protein
MPWNVYLLPKAKKYLLKQSLRDRARIELTIQMLKSYGPFIKPPFNKKIQVNLFELRIKGQNSFRIFYSNIKGNYYLVHIFKKKSQKIPQKEIKTALDRIKHII